MYKTLAELQAAYKSGALGSEDYLWLDNDTASVYVDGNEYNDYSSQDVFEMHPDRILREALTLLGILYDHV